MRRRNSVLLMLLACVLLFSCACSTNGGSAPGLLGGSQESPADIAEAAMDNFVKKISAGNYVTTPEDYIRTTVVSPEQVYFTGLEGSSSEINCAFVTLKGETFQGNFGDETLEDIRFVANGNAVDALGTLLPNGWIEASEGNMFELFYNNVDAPLEFTSKEECVKLTLLGLAGYNQSAIEYMEDVYMVLDAKDPTSVHFSAKMRETGIMIHYDDLDLTLEFGKAKSDARAEKWLKAPSYPPTRTAWTQDDIYMLDNVFFKGYGVGAFPFPEFASYALIFDDHAYDEEMIVRVKDAHATEEDLDAYVRMLLDNGYEEAEEELLDGGSAKVYRKLLRKEYSSYAELYPYFDDGFVLEGSLYYDEPSYEGLAEVSAALQEHGFAALPETDVVSGWAGTDQAASRSEGFAYFFDYDLYMPMIVSFSDRDKAWTYFEEYGKSLMEKGFTESYAGGEGRGMYTAVSGFTIFRFTFNEDEDTAILEFKKEKSLTEEEASRRIAEHGLPETDFADDFAARDQTRYRYEIGEFKGLYLSIYQTFESTEAAESFLDALVASLDEQDYLMMDPQKLGSQKAFLYFNEELAKYVAFDLFPGEDSADVNMEYVSIEPEEKALQSILRH